MLAKKIYSYYIRSPIYDEMFKVDDETTHTMAWISFSNHKPTYFANYSIFSSVSTAFKPLHLDLARFNKIRPIYGRVKLPVDLMPNVPKYVEMKIVSEETK